MVRRAHLFCISVIAFEICLRLHSFWSQSLRVGDIADLVDCIEEQSLLFDDDAQKPMPEQRGVACACQHHISII